MVLLCGTMMIGRPRRASSSFSSCVIAPVCLLLARCGTSTIGTCDRMPDPFPWVQVVQIKRPDHVLLLMKLERISENKTSA
ncbi:hypothetical protein BDR03DRAFT_972909 [Suillus americanus]|nr:hypothetical protein BDR03DRAFT_972909 [Suillus americanus]